MQALTCLVRWRRLARICSSCLASFSSRFFFFLAWSCLRNCWQTVDQFARSIDAWGTKGFFFDLTVQVLYRRNKLALNIALLVILAEETTSRHFHSNTVEIYCSLLVFGGDLSTASRSWNWATCFHSDYSCTRSICRFIWGSSGRRKQQQLPCWTFEFSARCACDLSNYFPFGRPLYLAQFLLHFPDWTLLMAEWTIFAITRTLCLSIVY